VNFYQHHLGDHIRKTAHLSILEEGALRRLLDAYYVREGALPADDRECYRLARATSKAERAAVDSMLREFFVKAEDGWHNRRADAEITGMREKGAKAKAAAESRWRRQQTPCERNADAYADAMLTKNPITNNQEKQGNGAWWKTEDGIERKARELGMEPKPRETYAELKSRIFERINTRSQA
jgi:uncharacterized protein YdaU (DUF1376 family)